MTTLSIRASVLIILLFGGLGAFCQTNEGVIGNWKIGLKDKAMDIEIYLAKDSNYYGKIINDSHTPSKNGVIILKKLKYNEPSKTFKGLMHPEDADIQLDVNVTVIDPDHLKMVAKKMLISRTVYLTRIK
ncbi:hypothetical protein [Mucilaginibacter sp. OK283]|jgi:hypothetical protein|uniref:hypothetical protein n=1 Tax=Mucilaginibacter sp. OK283 TaxID=1881049 RepID=UPI0008D6F929|nr:hypothetical protein [Mucilaginibacter sp. OK283]SEP40435.1 hypothetical protein SAMN05428947_114150 [Mucilaginibacter sp. OK283]